MFLPTLTDLFFFLITGNDYKASFPQYVWPVGLSQTKMGHIQIAPYSRSALTQLVVAGGEHPLGLPGLPGKSPPPFSTQSWLTGSHPLLIA